MPPNPITRDDCYERSRLVVARDKNRPPEEVKLKSKLIEDLLYSGESEIGLLKGPLDAEFSEYDCNVTKAFLKTMRTVRGVGWAAWLGIPKEHKSQT